MHGRDGERHPRCRTVVEIVKLLDDFRVVEVSVFRIVPGIFNIDPRTFGERILVTQLLAVKQLIHRFAADAAKVFFL